MNDRIAQMALEAGAYLDIDYPDTVRHVSITPEQLAAFARLVAEDCAKFVDPDSDHRMHPDEYLGGKECVKLLDGVAAGIRARYK